MFKETKKLYYENAYLKEFEAVVVDCCEVSGGFSVVLNQTLFYPEGGGQPADTGMLNSAKVIDVCEKDGVISHLTDTPLSIGDNVYGIVDWERRFSFMQHHTGEHIVSGIIHSLFGLENVGFHMGDQFVTFDTNGFISGDDIARVEVAANRAIFQNKPVSAQFYNMEQLNDITFRSKKIFKETSNETSKQDVRIVEVLSVDSCACCGLHCAATGEIGVIKLVEAQKYKGGMRISMLCGERAVLDYAKKNNDIYEISACLSVKPCYVTDGVEKLQNEIIKLKQQLVTYKNELFAKKADEIPNDTNFACFFEENLNPDDLRRFCMRICEKANIAAIFSYVSDNEYKFALGSHTEDMQILCKSMNAALHGKGGGQKSLVQGTVFVKKEEIEKFFSKFK